MEPIAAVFDMDNVLFPTEPLKFLAYRDVFRERLGIALEDTKERLGLSERNAMGLFLARSGVEGADVAALIAAKREAYYRILAAREFAPFAGADRLLEDLRRRGWKTGLATMSDRRSTDTLLDRFGFRDWFDDVLTTESVRLPKPDPEIYSLAAQRLGVSPSRCVAIEDSPAGVEAARSAGMKVLGVTNSVPRERLGADAVVDSMSGVDGGFLEALVAGRGCE
jgi:HAD superfamily hydrolase (TIGR01509 family)